MICSWKYEVWYTSTSLKTSTVYINNRVFKVFRNFAAMSGASATHIPPALQITSLIFKAVMETEFLLFYTITFCKSIAVSAYLWWKLEWKATTEKCSILLKNIFTNKIKLTTIIAMERYVGKFEALNL